MGEIEKKKAEEEEEFERFVRSWPESKLELLDGKLLVGNGLEGSRLLFQQILRGWKVEAVVALGSFDQWIEALCATYKIAPAEGDEFEALEAQAAAIEFEEDDLSLSPGSEGPYTGHHWVRSDINLALHRVSHLLGGGALGRDFVMKLGENGFTPDALFYKSRELNTLYEYYLDGPAEMVIEVTTPAHERYDREIKRELYARGGVPEYIIIDPDREKRRVEFWRLVNGDYQLQALDPDGRYRPESAPGLAIAPEHLWADDERHRYTNDQQPFIVGVTGDLLNAKPLNFWSELTLVVWDAPTRLDFEIYKDVSAFEDAIAPEINYVESGSWHFEEDADFAGAEIREI